MKKGEILFVSGIDTGIGKTVATGLMCRALQRSGRDWISVKMVQTGCDGFSEDLDAHRAMAGVGKFPEDDAGLTAPQIFKFPSSPLLASRLENRKVDLDKIASSVEACAAAHDVTLVEGAGGLCVPLTEDVLSIDFAAAQGWRLVLVTCGRLGAINHALLSLDAARMRGMSVAGIIHNSFFSDDPRLDDDAVEAISRHLVRLGFPPRIVRIPRVDDAADGVGSIDFEDILGLT